MGISNEQKLDQLFKTGLSRGDLKTGRDYFSENPVPQYINGALLFIDPIPEERPAALDPSTANHLSTDSTGIVQLLKEVRLDPVTGSDFAYASSSPGLMEKIIPDTYGTGYGYTITDASGSTVFLGVGSWSLDPNSGVLRFYDPASAAFGALSSSYFTITCYKYVGAVGMSNFSVAANLIELEDVNIPEGSQVDNAMLYWNESETSFQLKKISLADFAEMPSTIKSGDGNLFSLASSVTASNTAFVEFNPINVIDGDPTTSWLSQSTNQWLKISLDPIDSFALKRLVIAPYSNVTVRDFEVYGSNIIDPDPYEYNDPDIFTHLLSDTYSSEKNRQGFLIENEVSYSTYVILVRNTIDGNTGIRISEVEGYATVGNIGKGLVVDNIEEEFLLTPIVTQEEYEKHLNAQNPHGITPSGIEAVSQIDFEAHTDNINNPHQVTKDQVGLGNVLNEEQIPVSEKGVPGGVATLDSFGTLNTDQIPASLVGSVNLKGKWNALNNYPTLGDGGIGGAKGDYYIVGDAGSPEDNQRIDGISDWSTGDWIVNNETVWIQIRNTSTVASVNGRTGIVNLDTDTIPEGSVNEYYTFDKVDQHATVVLLNSMKHRQNYDWSVVVNPADEPNVPGEGETLPREVDNDLEVITGAHLKDHMYDNSRHTKISDGSITNSTAWSSAKIIQYLNSGEETHEASYDHSLLHEHLNKDELDKITDGSHETRIDNPHQVTKDQVGLANVDNIKQVPFSSIGQPNGIVPLDDYGKIHPSYLAIEGGLKFNGLWKPSENTQGLASGGVGGIQGDFFVVVEDGNFTLDGETSWRIGDWIVNYGDYWTKVEGSSLVVSVNGQTSVVVLDTDDIPEGTTNIYFTDDRVHNHDDVVYAYTLKHNQNTDTWLAKEVIDPISGLTINEGERFATSAEEIREHLEDRLEPVDGYGNSLGSKYPSNPHDVHFKQLIDVISYEEEAVDYTPDYLDSDVSSQARSYTYTTGGENPTSYIVGATPYGALNGYWVQPPSGYDRSYRWAAYAEGNASYNADVDEYLAVDFGRDLGTDPETGDPIGWPLEGKVPNEEHPYYVINYGDHGYNDMHGFYYRLAHLYPGAEEETPAALESANGDVIDTNLLPQTPHKEKGYIYPENNGKVINGIKLASQGGVKDFSIYASFNGTDWLRLFSGTHSGNYVTELGRQHESYEDFFWDNNLAFRFYKIHVHNTYGGAVSIWNIRFLDTQAYKTVAINGDKTGVTYKNVMNKHMVLDHFLDKRNPHNITPYQIGAPTRVEYQQHLDNYDAHIEDYNTHVETYDAHIHDLFTNPHNVTKTQVGLGNVDDVKQIPFASLNVPGGVPTLIDYGLPNEGRIDYDLLPLPYDLRSNIVDNLASVRQDLALSANQGRYLKGEVDKLVNDTIRVVSDLDAMVNDATASSPNLGLKYFVTSDSTLEGRSSMYVVKSEISGGLRGTPTQEHIYTNWNTFGDSVWFYNDGSDPNNIVDLHQLASTSSVAVPSGYVNPIPLDYYSLEATISSKEEENGTVGILIASDGANTLSLAKTSEFHYDYLVLDRVDSPNTLSPDVAYPEVVGAYEILKIVDYMSSEAPGEGLPAPEEGARYFIRSTSGISTAWGPINSDGNEAPKTLTNMSLIEFSNGYWRVLQNQTDIEDLLAINGSFSVKNLDDSGNYYSYDLNSHDVVYWPIPIGGGLRIPQDDDRYLLTDVASLASSWGTVDKYLDGTPATLTDNSIVAYLEGEWRIVITGAEFNALNDNQGIVSRLKTDDDQVLYKWDDTTESFVVEPLSPVTNNLQLVYNIGQPTSQVISSVNINSVENGWNGDFYRLRVTRYSDKVVCWSSQPNSIIIDESTKQEVLFSSNALLSGFSNPSGYGFFCINQSSAKVIDWEIIQSMSQWDETTSVSFSPITTHIDLVLETTLISESETKALTVKTGKILDDKKLDKVDFETHTSAINPHNITKDDIGLGAVVNAEQITLNHIGSPDGVAALDENGKLLRSNFPFPFPEEATGLAFIVEDGFVQDSQLPRGLAEGLASLDLQGKVPMTELNTAVANGLATLDGSGYVPLSQLKTNTLNGFPLLNAEGKLDISTYLKVGGDQGLLLLDAEGKVPLTNVVTNVANGLVKLNADGTIPIELVRLNPDDSPLLDEFDKIVDDFIRKGEADTVASLDADAKVPLDQMNARVTILDEYGYIPLENVPAALIGSLIFRGTWDATLNDPQFDPDGGGASKGEYYVVSVSGNYNLDGYTDWSVGDWLINNGDKWYKLDNSAGVQTINNQSGYVTLTTDDIDEGLTNIYFTEDRVINLQGIQELITLKHEKDKDLALATGTADAVTATELKEHLTSIAANTVEYVYPDETTGLLHTEGNPHQVTALQVGALPIQKFYDHSMDFENPHRVEFKPLKDVLYKGVDYDLTTKRFNPTTFNNTSPDSKNLVYASTVLSGTYPYNVIDDLDTGMDELGNPVVGTLWSATQNENQWLRFDFGPADRQFITKFTIAPNYVNANSGVTSFRVLGSHYRDADYVELFTMSESPVEGTEYAIASPDWYSYYKFEFLTADTTYIGVKAIQLFGDTTDLGLQYDYNGEAVIAQKRLPNYDELIYTMNQQNLLGSGSIAQFALGELEILIGNNLGSTVKGKIVKGESLAGPLTGINKIFSFSHIPLPGTVEVFLSGLSLIEGPGEDFVVDYVNKTVTFTDAPYASDKLKINYIYEISG